MALSFKQKTVQMILQQFFKDEKTKVNSEALELITEVITLFVEEAIGRTSNQAKRRIVKMLGKGGAGLLGGNFGTAYLGRTYTFKQKDGDTELSLEHFEKILPQLLLDI